VAYQKNYENFLLFGQLAHLGVSRAVDTKFKKKFGRSRMKVAVLDPDLIPDLVDVVIGDFVYELQFRVEKDTRNTWPFNVQLRHNIEFMLQIKICDIKLTKTKTWKSPRHKMIM